MEYYLAKVGGPAENADKGRIYLVKADGSVFSRTQEGLFGFSWDPDTSRWTSTGFLAASATTNETAYLTYKVVRSMGMVVFDNQARV